MARYMKAVAENADELSEDERRLFSVAYSNVIGSYRTPWRTLSSVEQKEDDRGTPTDNLRRVREYRQKIEQEMSAVCAEVLTILDTVLIPKSTTIEGKVFYLKMKGDYYRYIANNNTTKGRESTACAMEAYKAGSELAKGLAPNHPTRLGLALNFSVFYYEIMTSYEDACSVARSALNDAILEQEHCPPSENRDGSLIMGLLRDNLSLWTTEMGEGADACDH
ncbi:14-3-3 protein epsilon [Pelomyxa schiedti]|nr:14-3-3 protein epsilon [Pelomyxa schiedti]